jgi:hypothetical protein
MGYELWDTETRNLVDMLDSEDEALAAARDLIALNDAAYPAALALTYEDGRGRTTLLAQGADLARRSGLAT